MPKDKLAKIQKILYIVIASAIILCGAITFGWGYFIAPQIDKRIDVKLEPVVEAVTYQSFLWVEQMDSATVRRANERFKAWKSGSLER
jgi:hypothetical protein